MTDTEVSMTIEQEPHGYGQHMLTVERGNGESVQCMILTGKELERLRCLLDMYNEWAPQRDAFTDPTGRTPEQQRAANAEGSQA